MRFYVELARHGQTIGADVERPLDPRQARIAHTIYNSRRYAGWLVLVYTVQMSLSFYEPAYFGQPADEVPQAATSWLPATLDLACILAYGADGLMQVGGLWLPVPEGGRLADDGSRLAGPGE